jgi:hypothetical protein
VLIFEQVGIGRRSKCQRLAGELRLIARDLCLEVRDLQLILAHIRIGERLVQGREQLAGFHLVAFAHVDALDQRRVERLKHGQQFILGDNLTLRTGDHAIDVRQETDRNQNCDQAGQGKYGYPRNERLARFADGVGFRLKAPDDRERGGLKRQGLDS